MTSIMLPALLVVGALVGVLWVLGRRLPDIRDALRAGGAGERVEDAREVSLAPSAARVERPTRAGARGFLVSLAAGARTRRAELGRSLRVAGRGLGRFWALLLRTFHRVPTATRRASALYRREEPAASVPTTRDVTETLGQPLRFPEPAPERQRAPSDDGEAARRADVAAPAITRPEAASLAGAPPATEVAVSEGRAAEGEPEDVPVITVETVGDVTRDRERRVVGRVRQRPPGPSSAAGGAQRKKPHGRGRPAAWASTTETIPALIAEGNLDRAESLLIDILSKDPRDAESYRLLGTVYLKREDVRQAREVFEEALRRSPGHPGIHGPLGACYVAEGKYSNALSMYQRAHEADETNVEYLEQLLVISSRMDRRPLVKVIAGKILALDPGHRDAKKALARVEA